MCCRRRSGRDWNGCPRRRQLDQHPLCFNVKPRHRRHRLRLDRRLFPHPFVAGLDSYMPSWLGNVHPRYATPYAALIVQGIVSAVLVILNFVGAGVQETFQKLLSSCGGAATGSIRLHVRCVGEVRSHRVGTERPVRENDPVSGRSKRIPDDDPRHRVGIFFPPSRSRRCGDTNYGCSAARCSSSVWPHFSFLSTAAAKFVASYI